MDIPRLEALNLYWKAHPPTHILVAAYMGVGKEPEKSDGGDLLAMFPQSNVPITLPQQP